VRASAAALLLAAAVVAGAGASRLIWPTPATPAASSPSTTYPGFGSGAGSGGYVPGGTSGGSGTSGTSGASGTSGGSTEGAGGPSDVSTIAKQVDPDVVDINVVFNYEDAEGAGTGIVLTSNGEILTNNHVVDGATKISVTDVGNGKTYNASVVGYDSTHDVAVLQLQGASGLATAKLSTSSPSTGEAVVAIGNAGGTGGTPTSAGGSVTGTDQSITASDALDGTNEKLSGLIEVNANIESGDSGGPLVNASGQVIGMDTAAYAGFSFSASGNQGFAIPISEATSIAKQIEAGKGSSDVHVGATAFLGVMVSTEAGQTTPGYASPNVSGAQICDLSYCVVSGGPAQKAGLQVGDVITSLAGKAVTTPAQLTHDLVVYHPGQTVKVSWVTPTGQSQSGDLKLASGPPA
jgi:S1-C subfamily serine protease